MIIYVLYDYDEMDDRMYVEGLYATRALAEAQMDLLSEFARIRWMAHCSTAGRANWRTRAHVTEMPLVTACGPAD